MRTLSIKWRVALGATLLCIALISLVGFLQMHFMRKDLVEVISDQQFTLVSRVAENIDSRLAQSREAIAADALAFPPAMLSTPARIREYYAHRPVIMSLFDDILVFMPNGQLIADSPELPARKALNTADRAFFQEVLATQRPVISEPVISKTRREPIIQMAAPIMDGKGNLAGVVVGVIRLYKPNFLGNLGETKIGKTGHFSLLTREPKVVYVAHPDKTRILQPQASGTPPAVVRALDGFEGSIEGSSRNRVPALFTSKSLSMAPWVLIAVAPTEEVFSPIASAEQRLLMILALVTALILPLVWVFTWRTLGPLKDLRDAIANLRITPDVFVPVPVTRTDEFGDLTRAFNALMRDRLAAQTAQQESESLLRLIADNMPALIAFLDHDLRYTFVNDRYTEWFGKTPAEIINRTSREVFGDDNFESVREHYNAALKGERVSYDHELKTLGATRHAHTTLLPHIGATGKITGIFKLTTDISERKQVELVFNDLVRLDSLTGLCNRHGFDERLAAALQRGARNGAWLALLFLDVDNFKTINDSMGHAAGDDVLQEFARRLSSCVRVTDTVARLGGDEFTIILEGLHKPAEASDVADKILRALDREIITRVGDCNVTSSIGIAICRRGAIDAVELLRQADEAVYVAKSNGRNQYHVANVAVPSLKLVDTKAQRAEKQDS